MLHVRVRTRVSPVGNGAFPQICPNHTSSEIKAPSVALGRGRALAIQGGGGAHLYSRWASIPTAHMRGPSPALGG
jgi:hypothetical protein